MNKSLMNTQGLQSPTNNSKVDLVKKSPSPSEFWKSENSELFCVKWTHPILGFNQFVQDYRDIIGYPLGGSRVCRHHYTDVTISKVLSVGPSDNRSSLPQRISLSNFKIGAPITSDGCIYRYIDPINGLEPEYLLIKRDDSVSYIDLVRGNYRESQLFFMIQELPLNARDRLLTYADDYDTLWVDLHMKVANGDTYEFGKEAFIKIAPHFKELFELIPSVDPDGIFLWGFPKGRPQWSDNSDSSLIYNLDETSKPSRTIIPESPFECALREFYEETNGISLQNQTLLFSEPIIERFLGSNSKNYQTDYFVFQTNIKHELKQFETKDTPIRKISTDEVSEIKWVKLSELSQYLRSERLELVNYIETHLPLTNPTEVNSIWKCPTDMIDCITE